jgi:arabinose-5-phosphate isomerase
MLIIEEAKRVIKIESEAILSLIDRIDEEFVKVIDTIANCEGKVILTGMGKSGLICRKIASTLSSTGTPSFFLHPAEGIHGDIGMLSKKDVLIAVSNSGETEEIKRIIPIIKRMGIPLIVITGNRNSTLAKMGDIILDINIKEEACPLGLAQTASTTATLALGDAIAIALLIKKDFKKEDFIFLHPGGTIGKRFIKVEDLMHVQDSIPMVDEKASMPEVLEEMSLKKLGITGIKDEKGNLVGVITDGDLRRALQKGDNLLKKRACDIMTTEPKCIDKKDLAAKALNIMEKYSITSLFVYSGVDERRPVGIIHMHDLLKAGVV